MRFSFFASCLLSAVALAGCGSDFDLTESSGGDQDADAAVLEADPPDTTPPPADTNVVDSATPVDSTTSPDSAMDSTIEDTFMPSCTSPADCPGADGECGTRTCVSGTCGRNDLPEGTPGKTQIPGDCKKSQCDGRGLLVTVYDPTDKANDDKECTNDSCMGAVPVFTPVPAGTSCTKGGTVCNGMGACVECVDASTCPGSDNACRKRTCVVGKCGMSYVADGAPSGTQVAGDCQQIVCDGMGTQKNVALNTDVPVDGNVCTADVCTSGTPSNPPLGAGTPCGGSYVCNGGGKCVQCVAPSNCPVPTNTCYTATCSGNVCGTAYKGNNASCTLSDGKPGYCWWNTDLLIGTCYPPIG